MATFGSVLRNVLQESADASAISASCSAVGLGMVAQSAKMNDPFAPYSVLSVAITKQEEANLMPGLVLMMLKAASNTLPVVFSAPATIASALPSRTIIAPQRRGSTIPSNASSSLMPLCLRSS